jgi:predicted site-specific integrase-resolvase
MPKPIWIPEKEAAAKLGYSPKTLRRYCKSGKLAISYTHINRRNYHYDLKGIEKIFNDNAFIIYD